MSVAKGKMQWSIHGRLLLAGGLMLLSLTGLSVWNCMPIYPDEIAFRMQLGRYIQDQGVVQGLYPLCASNIKETPFFFVIPAWIFSQLDLAFSSVAMRIFPLTAVLLSLSLVIWRAALKGMRPAASVVATTAVIGVAGSGLILARYEYIQIVNLGCCLLAFYALDSPSNRPIARFLLLVPLLLISSLFSLYAHPQGLLFLPLTVYLFYRLVHPALGNLRTALLALIVFGVLARGAIIFHHSNCVEYPEIVQFWDRMTFNWNEFEVVRFVDWMAVKLDRYLLSFQYIDNYAINYLPGITVENGWPQNLLAILNQSIRFILCVNLLLSIFVNLVVIAVMMKRYGQRHKIMCEPLVATSLDQVRIMSLLLALPLIFLFFYDAAHNFYRSFLLNFLIAIQLAIYLSQLRLTSFRKISNVYFGLCGTIVLSSLTVNFWWFTDRLRAGYEGPSISMQQDWDNIDRDVKSLTQDCSMDLSRNGGIVVDDMTYDSLKKYSHVYAATYIALSAELTRLPMSDVLGKIGPNYAVARCDTFRSVGIPIQRSRNELCCTNFIATNSVY
jgi:hypothetical protein